MFVFSQYHMFVWTLPLRLLNMELILDNSPSNQRQTCTTKLPLLRAPFVKDLFVRSMKCLWTEIKLQHSTTVDGVLTPRTPLPSYKHLQTYCYKANIDTTTETTKAFNRSVFFGGRMLLACGAIEAITWATGESASASCAMWQASSQAMWDAVSAIAISASSEASLQAVTASVQEADSWGQDIGTFCWPVSLALQAGMVVLCSTTILPNPSSSSRSIVTIQLSDCLC